MNDREWDLSGVPNRATCLHCGYRLYGLTQPLCPECGESFDPADPSTWDKPRRSAWLRLRVWWRASSYALPVGIAGFIALLSWAMLSKGTVEMFLDSGSIAIAAGTPLALLLACYGWNGAVNAVVTLLRGTHATRVAVDAANFFKLAAAFSLCCGFLGTVVGLVLMLANLDDPAAIGPGMAVALLTQLYGVLQALLCCALAVFILRRHNRTEANARLDRMVNQALPVAAAATAIGLTSSIVLFPILFMAFNV